MINWIKVNSHSALPKVGDKILVLVQDSSDNRGIFVRKHEYSTYGKTNPWYFGIHNDNVKVTHWAECPTDFLPEMPLRYLNLDEKAHEIVSSNPLSLGKQITTIDELFDVEIFQDGYTQEYSGYRLTLSDNNSIMFMIDSYQQCCESFGYLSTNDNIQDFIGSTIQKVEIVTGDNYTKSDLIISNYNGKDTIEVDVKECVFLIVTTDKGELTFAVYNAHNGYYSHDVKVFVGDKVYQTFNI